jgi:kynureninase
MVSCTRNLKETRLEQPGAGTSLLIAGDASEFKDAIRMAIIDRYRATCNIDIINIDKLPKINGSQYDAVLIMDTCLAWSNFNPSVKAFLDKSQNRNVVFFMTADDPDWTFTYNGVDAITSASEKENQAIMIRRLTAAITEILER